MTPVANKRLAFLLPKTIPPVRPGGKSIRKGGQTAADFGCLDRKPSTLSSHASTAGASGCWSVYGIFPERSRRTADSRYGIWGAINLLEGYGNDNPGAKSQGMKQLMAGGGVALIGTTLVPLLANLFG